MAHSAHLQQAAQSCSSRGGYTGDNIEQALGFFVDDGAQANLVVIADLAQADGIGKILLAAQQLPSFGGIVSRAHARDLEIFAQEFGFEGEILRFSAKGNGDDFFHGGLLLVSKKLFLKDYLAEVFLGAAFFAADLTVGFLTAASVASCLGGSTCAMSASHCFCVMYFGTG